MSNSRRMRASLLAFAALAAMAAGKNWTTQVEETPASHVYGNPDAELTVTDFSSYTCPHCGEYARTGGETIKLAYVGPGQVKTEIRHVIRNPIDLAAALAAWCGPADKFAQNHTAIMFAQDKWMAKAEAASGAQRQRWLAGPIAGRMRAIASDLGFYEIFEQRGYDRPALDRCLADTELMKTLVDATVSDAETYGVRGTPSFAIDGKLLDSTHTWQALQPQIQASLAAASAPEGLDAESRLSEDSAFSLD